jgi:hypothetical protein
VRTAQRSSSSKSEQGALLAPGGYPSAGRVGRAVWHGPRHHRLREAFSPKAARVPLGLLFASPVGRPPP